jgi:hypothetical protein
MNCPICNHDRFQVWWVSDNTEISDESKINVENRYPDSISCSKCGVSLYEFVRGWRDWTGSLLYWDEESKCLKTKATPKYKADSNEGLIRALKSLPQDVIDKLREQCKEA